MWRTPSDAPGTHGRRAQRRAGPVDGAGDRGQRPDQALRRPLAVDDLSFTVAVGRIVGFLGPNGAGKTTTLRVLLQLVPADGRRSPSAPATAGSTSLHRSGRCSRRHTSSGAHRPQPPARAGRPAGVAAARVDELLELVGLERRREPARRRLLARHAPAARPRRRAARRPAGAHPRRAGERPGPAGHPLAARLPTRARAARAGPSSSPATCWPRSRRPPTTSS